MKWIDVLNNWKNGITFKYPTEIKNRFHWNTSVLQNNGNIEYKESFKINNNLPEIQNESAFIEYIKKSKNKYVVAFPNINKDTMLVIPIPILGKNYATLKDFVDNAPQEQQIYFWKKVAKVAKKLMTRHKSVWISVHGLGVPYTHVRISSKPKYYFDDNLAK